MDNNSIAKELLSIAKDLMRPNSDGVAIINRLDKLKAELGKLNKVKLRQQGALKQLAKFVKPNRFKSQGSFMNFAEGISSAIIFGDFEGKDKKVLEDAKKVAESSIEGLWDVFQANDQAEIKKRGDANRKAQSALKKHFGKRLP